MGDLVSKEHDNLDTIMTVSFSDPTYLSKVQQIEEFSNYLISPLRKNYKVFHLSLTIVFFAIDKFLTLKRAEGDIQKRKTIENLQKVRARITTPIGCEIFSPTVNHLLPERTQPNIALYPSIHDTAPLHAYKPHLPTDQDSRDNLLTWLPYPGILKIVQLARSIERAFEDTPSQESTDQLRDLATTMIRNSRILAKSKAGPIACSITISALFSGLTSHHRDVIFPLCQEFIEGKPGLHIEDIFKPICTRVESLITSPNNWPQAPKYSISGIYDVK